MGRVQDEDPTFEQQCTEAVGGRAALKDGPDDEVLQYELQPFTEFAPHALLLPALA